jgi:hypothetical protein
MASVSFPAKRGIGVLAFGPSAWHPVHDAAPGGASAAEADVMAAHANMTTKA